MCFQQYFSPVKKKKTHSISQPTNKQNPLLICQILKIYSDIFLLLQNTLNLQPNYTNVAHIYYDWFCGCLTVGLWVDICCWNEDPLRFPRSLKVFILPWIHQSNSLLAFTFWVMEQLVPITRNHCVTCGVDPRLVASLSQGLKMHCKAWLIMPWLQLAWSYYTQGLVVFAMQRESPWRGWDHMIKSTNLFIFIYNAAIVDCPKFERKIT